MSMLFKVDDVVIKTNWHTEVGVTAVVAESFIEILGSRGLEAAAVSFLYHGLNESK